MGACRETFDVLCLSTWKRRGALKRLWQMRRTALLDTSKHLARAYCLENGHHPMQSMDTTEHPPSVWCYNCGQYLVLHSKSLPNWVTVEERAAALPPDQGAK